MIVVDTNVLSELMRPTPEPAVIRWAGEHLRKDAYTTAITKAEMLSGISRMPRGRRQETLSSLVREMFVDVFADRILSFDSGSAEHYASVIEMRRKMGRPIEPLDAQIAAIAIALGAPVVTRNVVDFEACGIVIINPWIA